jgi:large subunit ribosomal protein L21
MYAIIETGGKQYRVTEGDVLNIEKLLVWPGDEVIFDKVLILGDGDAVQIGTPYVEAAQVFGKVVENGKEQKVIIFKYKSKKDYRKKKGHRQPYTMVEIIGMGTDKPKAAKPVAKEAKPVAKEAKPVEAPIAAVAKAKAVDEAPSLKSMKKDELIAFAKEKGIEVDSKATKPVIIEAIEAQLK